MAAGKTGKWAVRIGLGTAALLLLALLAVWLYLRGSLAQLDGERQAAGLAAPVTVARDARGVPLIAGRDRLDLSYASGFVHAQERYFQMDLLRRVGAGELAELFGPKALVLDRGRRLHRFRARARARLASLPPADRALLDRYVAGVNDGLQALRAKPFEYTLIGLAPRPWLAEDSLLVIYAMYFDLQGNLENRELARGWLRSRSTPEQLAFLLPEATRWDAPLDAERIDAAPAPVPDRAPAWWGTPGTMQAKNTAALDDDARYAAHLGSNNWALAGSRTGGPAIVSDDMHLGLQLPNIWYRAALQYPDAQGRMRRMVGVMLPGAPPVLVAGSNGRVAWGFTNSYGDFLDLEEARLETASDGSQQVRTRKGVEPLRVAEETLLAKGAPAETLRVRETSLGPLNEAGGQLYAIHWTAHAPDAVNLDLRRMEDADTVEQALAVAVTLGIPAQNIVAGDSAGRIGWTVAGRLPRRAKPGPAASFPLGLDSDAGWAGWLDPAAYPRIQDPAGGQLVTANNRLLAGPGAALIGDGGFDLGARARQARDAVTALGPRADVRGAYGVMLDDRALFMAGWRDRALAVLDDRAVAGHARRAQFRHLLKTRWTGRAGPGDVAYRLARNFMHALHDELYGGADAELAGRRDRTLIALATSRWPATIARLLDEQPRGWLPARYADWRAVQLAAIDRAIAELGGDGATLESATWGERNTAAIAHPIAQAAPLLRRWLSAPPDRLPGDSHMPRVAGPKTGQSERMTVMPGREEAGLFAMPGGQSGHPLSPFFLAGHAEWASGGAGPLLPGPARYTLRLRP